MKTEKVAVTTNNKTNGGSNMKGFFGGMKKCYQEKNLIINIRMVFMERI